MKLKTEQRYDPNLNVMPMNTTSPVNDGLADYKNTDYVGNIIYETVKIESSITNKTRILVDGGYIENGVYHYYLADHLGSNRVVINASGTITQRNHYYPFGTAFAEKYDGGKNQKYKYNGKELDDMHQLNLYDYSARYYESAVGRFTSVDPLAEKYYSISPYAYVANNPINAVDPRGDSIWFTIDKDILQLKLSITQVVGLMSIG
ncbi:RHS repeat domain-containing protein [Dysgonomonas sp. Marseille-P4677]|uniref:RHS repeat domain-containing protein n=1 Tax=Dysgonomonas sp. Marseille-P4677 TaxID=2364790 RepID=UPI001F15ED81|nr:RHS repeat-associated core domain-containing protein [Dysgonomonas sp. Marseille-P4677]